MFKKPKNFTEQIPTFPGVLNASRRMIRSMKAKADAKRTFSEKFADWITTRTGSITFFILNILWFTAWIVINLEFIPGIKAFDPYPFGLLTTIVSLEAIVLAIFVLISQNRQAMVDDLREEVDLQVDIITEQELTKLLRILIVYLEKNGMDLTQDKELESMLKPTNMEKIESALEKQILIQ